MIKLSDNGITPITKYMTHGDILGLIDGFNIQYEARGWEELELTYWLLKETWKCKDCNILFDERIELCEKCGDSNIVHSKDWIKDGLKRK